MPDYVRFLPAPLRDGLAEPTSTWWQWRADVRVHVARVVRPDAPARVVLAHGAGAYSAVMAPLVCAVVGDRAELVMPDLPLFGRTEVCDRSSVTYQDWIDLLCDLIRSEADGRPTVLLGGSIGGMLAYEVAGRLGPDVVHASIVTCLLDPADPQALAATANSLSMAKMMPTLLRLLRPWSRRLWVKIRWLAKADRLSTDPELGEEFLNDPLGADAPVPLSFIDSWVHHPHLDPGTYPGPPLVLAHPADDIWSRPEISARFLARLSSPTRFRLLHSCGHFPMEQPGLNQLNDEIERLVGAPA